MIANAEPNRPVVVDKNVVILALNQQDDGGNSSLVCQDCIDRIRSAAIPAGHTPTMLGWYWFALNRFKGASKGIGSGSLVVNRWLLFTAGGHGIRVEDSNIEQQADIAGVSDEDHPFAKLTMLISATLTTTDGDLREVLDLHIERAGSAAATVQPSKFDPAAANYVSTR